MNNLNHPFSIQNNLNTKQTKMSNGNGTLQKFKGNLDRMFDKTLTDLVRGIRNNKDNEVCTNFFRT